MTPTFVTARIGGVITILTYQGGDGTYEFFRRLDFSSALSTDSLPGQSMLDETVSVSRFDFDQGYALYAGKQSTIYNATVSD